ncbi:MAG: large-conductance mechanosensitive channel protein MscL [Alistipes sp.]|nr:large-conductance mechanosensitive channel protein MscL [Alistipes sp.]
MGFLKEFKAFALKGNVVDMAVGVIIGGAFGKIVTSLVNNIIMPPVGCLLGGKNFADLSYKLKEATPAVMGEDGTTVIKEAEPEVLLKYGEFIQTCLDFAIIALSVFVMIKLINRLSNLRKKEEEAAAAEPAPAPEPTKEETLLTEIRDILKEKK